VILAIDTTHEFGSLALWDAGRLLEEVAVHAPTGFSHVLYPELSKLLERHSVKVADIDCFAAAKGPGSFTGVRVGLAAVKGLAEALGRLAIGVSNLQAIASFGTKPLRAAVLDARRREIFGAVYNAGGELVQPEVVMELQAFLSSVPEDAEIVSPDELPVASTRSPRALAAAIARIAERNQGNGDPAGVDANYIRRPDIRA
jgi:tRNA threonylcarbamoyladenosine biosynthesis protein TsaB